ncbi:MAG TPA: DUF202 domain-containing protein [Candidatus Binatia bacterium]|nr:DUF202 domain-containing protein [Candidatus Binatia bacterium]
MNDEKLEKLQAHYSNERTLLSYTRTAASVLVLAVALLRFFDNRNVIYLGWLCLGIGLVIQGVGVVRYFQERKRINSNLTQ